MFGSFAHYLRGEKTAYDEIDIVVVFNPNLGLSGGAGLNLAVDLLKTTLGCGAQTVWEGITLCYNALEASEVDRNKGEYEFASDLAMRCFLLVSMAGPEQSCGLDAQKIADRLAEMGTLFEADSTDVNREPFSTVFNLRNHTPVKITFCTTPVGKTLFMDSRSACAVHFAQKQPTHLVAFPVCEELDASYYDAMLRAREFALSTNSVLKVSLEKKHEICFASLVHWVRNLSDGWVPQDPTMISIRLFFEITLSYLYHHPDTKKKERISLAEYLSGCVENSSPSSVDGLYNNLWLLSVWVQNVNRLSYECRQNVLKILPNDDNLLNSWFGYLTGESVQREGVLLREFLVDALLASLHRAELSKKITEIRLKKSEILKRMDSCHLPFLCSLLQARVERYFFEETRRDGAVFRSFSETFGQDRFVDCIAEQLFEEFVAEGKEEDAVDFYNQFEPLSDSVAEKRGISACRQFILLCEKIIKFKGLKGLRESFSKQIVAVLGEFMQRHPTFDVHTACVNFFPRLPHDSLPFDNCSWLMINSLAQLFPQKSTELTPFLNSRLKSLTEAWERLFSASKSGTLFLPGVKILFAIEQKAVQASGKSKKAASSSQNPILRRSDNEARVWDVILTKNDSRDQTRVINALVAMGYPTLKGLNISSGSLQKIVLFLLGKQQLSSTEFSFVVNLYKDRKELIKDKELADFLLQALKKSPRDALFEELLKLLIIPVIQQAESHPLAKSMTEELTNPIRCRRELMKAVSEERSLQSSASLLTSWNLLLMIEQLSQTTSSEEQQKIPESLDLSLSLAYKATAFALYYEQSKNGPAVPSEVKKRLFSTTPPDKGLSSAEKLMLSSAAVKEGAKPSLCLPYQPTLSLRKEPFLARALNEMFVIVCKILETSTNAKEFLAAEEWLDRVVTPNLLLLKPPPHLVARCILTPLCQKSSLSQEQNKRRAEIANSMMQSFQQHLDWKKGIVVLVGQLSERPKEISAENIFGLITALKKFNALDAECFVAILKLTIALSKEWSDQLQEKEELNKSLFELQAYTSTLYKTSISDNIARGATFDACYELLKTRRLPALIASLTGPAADSVADPTKKTPKLAKQFVCSLAELFAFYYSCASKKEVAFYRDANFSRGFYFFVCYAHANLSTSDVNWLMPLRMMIQHLSCAVDKAVEEQVEKKSPPPFMRCFDSEFVGKISHLVRYQGDALIKKTGEVRLLFHSDTSLKKLESVSEELGAFFQQHCGSIRLLSLLNLLLLHKKTPHPPTVQTMCGEFQRMGDVDAACSFFYTSLILKRGAASNRLGNAQNEAAIAEELSKIHNKSSRHIVKAGLLFSDVIGGEASVQLELDYLKAFDSAPEADGQPFVDQTISILIAKMLTCSFQGDNPNTEPLLSWLTDRFEAKKKKKGFVLAFHEHMMMLTHTALSFEFSQFYLESDLQTSREVGKRFLYRHLENFGSRLFLHCCLENSDGYLDIGSVMAPLFSQVGWVDSSMLLPAFMKGVFKGSLNARVSNQVLFIWQQHCGNAVASISVAQIRQLTEVKAQPTWNLLVQQYKSLLEEVLVEEQGLPDRRVDLILGVMTTSMVSVQNHSANMPREVVLFICQSVLELAKKIEVWNDADPENTPLLKKLESKEKTDIERLLKAAENELQSRRTRS
ncbi:hypothetical protein JYU14_03005 [Simkania negevensis]|uniref:Uncharacterized protein n=1 Tax=Simkania negevensis TaxID=83561 RepID=A0ABS3AQM6_9BACT|nr:hypothetical protein [Simkania negevensis]